MEGAVGGGGEGLSKREKREREFMDMDNSSDCKGRWGVEVGKGIAGIVMEKNNRIK